MAKKISPELLRRTATGLDCWYRGGPVSPAQGAALLRDAADALEARVTPERLFKALDETNIGDAYMGSFDDPGPGGWACHTIDGVFNFNKAAEILSAPED